MLRYNFYLVAYFGVFIREKNIVRLYVNVINKNIYQTFSFLMQFLNIRGQK